MTDRGRHGGAVRYTADAGNYLHPSTLHDSHCRGSRKIPWTTRNVSRLQDPTEEPTVEPTLEPSFDPTVHPTEYPTLKPTVAPSRFEVGIGPSGNTPKREWA